MPQRQVIAPGCALLLGAVIAFPMGLLLGRGGGGGEEGGRPALRTGAEFRDVYSPSLYTDAHFLEQQRRNVEALEQACRSTGQFCAEARQGRRLLAEMQQGR